MKRVQRDKRFEKHFRQRIAPNRKLVAAFRERYNMFYVGVRGYPVNDHALHGNFTGKRAWSVTSDVRVIYEETEHAIIFVDIGTHAQVYE